MFYRLVANKDGSIASCEQHEGSHDGKGRSVHYIEANSREEACVIYARKWDKISERKKAIAIVWRQSGACQTCGRPCQQGLKSCEKCLKRSNAACKKLYHARKAAGICTTCGKNPAKLGRGACENCEAQRLLLRQDSNPELRRGRGRKKTVISDEEKAAKMLKYHKRTGSSAFIARRLYRSCLEAFESMTPSRYRGWLVARIHEEQEKIDSKRGVREPIAAE